MKKKCINACSESWDYLYNYIIKLQAMEDPVDLFIAESSSWEKRVL